MLTEKTFSHAGISINYAEGPPSGVPLVMLHGITARWQTFLPVMSMLMPRYHLFAPDLRGHGKSTWVKAGYVHDDDVVDMAAFVREKVDEPAVVLGWSLGAMVALTLAGKAPELVSAIILVDPPLAEIAEDKSFMEPFRDYFRALHAIMVRDVSPAERRADFAELHTEASEIELRIRYRDVYASDPMQPLSFANGTRFAGHDLKSSLESVQCPVLIMRGVPELGSAVDEECAALAKQNLQECVQVIVPDVGHGIHDAQPAVFAKIVTDFIESL